MDNNNESLSLSSSSSIDLSVFKKDSNCNNNDNFKSCPQIRALLSGLKYYQLLDIISNKNDRDIFDNCLTEIYSSSYYQ